MQKQILHSSFFKLSNNTDRNRTTPFALTGNRIEFRVVGSEANCDSAMKLDTIRYVIDKLEQIVDDSLWPLPK